MKLKKSVTDLRKEFELKLDEVYKIRTNSLRRSVGIRTGTKKKINNALISQYKNKLRSLTIDIFKSQIDKEIRNHITEVKPWKVEGHGRDPQRYNFTRWFKKELGDCRNFVYTFKDSAGKYIYIGRTQNGRQRPANHFKVYWFNEVKRIEILLMNKTAVPLVECLLIHRHSPKRNKQPQGQKQHYARKCFICQIHKDIDLQMEQTLNKK